MKFVRFGKPGHEKPGMIDPQGGIRDISTYVSDINPNSLSEPFILQQFVKFDWTALPLVDSNVRIGPCVGSIGKIICIGFNSQQHALEMGVNRSNKSEPIIFLKPSSALAGPYDPIVHTRHTKKLDWEAELAIVIGKQGKYISLEHAKDHIFGYACFNDLSERYLQFETEDSQFTKGKCFDGAATLGPYVVCKSDIPNAHDLHIQLWVNDQLRQDFNSKDYIYSEEQIIVYLSQYFTLYPGDIISMGSAPGSASAWGSDCFLQPGDEVKLEISGLGKQCQAVIKE
ncbi:MAG: fumarylacetoacetate hydrolase family protein [Legionellaceae bacterium]|nr:fumarylacetoacetate hydrolase family protein [Legionellaceae bacterium]MBP9775682.1 fumarylacetoacetate hydrolase family protein [Legionellaceae bacterium]